MRVTVWNENVHEQDAASLPAKLYPNGMHGAIVDGIRPLLAEHVHAHSHGAGTGVGATAHSELVIRTATLDEPEHGLTDAVLADTDVLLWWGHVAHDKVSDEVVERVRKRVLEGMGILVLHSGHYSKIFIRLMGSTCSLRWRNDGDRELVWTVNPTHPIAQGVPHPIVIDEQEMYGESFDIPTPDELIFVSSFSGGEVFRSGATWRRGLGKVFYFSPGDQEYPVYHHPDIHRVLANGILWAMPSVEQQWLDSPNSPRDWFLG